MKSTMSKLGWVDFSSEDRELVRKVMAMMREPGTLDELGIGQVRDAFADLLFPGISTIQTRAKYFITVPRILRDYDNLSLSQKRQSKPLEAYLKEQENEVARLLTQMHGDEETGIIGRTQTHTKDGVARRPSSVYWNGLRQLGIIDTDSSLAEFCRHYGSNQSLSEQASHEYGEDDAGHLGRNQRVHLPKGKSENWQEGLSLRLSKNEAKFLVNKIKNARILEQSVLGQLYLHGLTDAAVNLNIDEKSDFSQLKTFLIQRSEISGICKSRLEAAETFSFAILGPHLRYNIVLAEKNGFMDKADEYQDEYADWSLKAQKALSTEQVDEWLDIAQVKTINPATKTFLQGFIQQVQGGNSVKQLDAMVQKQALANKKKRSLLHKKLNNDGWVGMRRLDYRWGSAQTILRDIQQGLAC